MDLFERTRKYAKRYAEEIRGKDFFKAVRDGNIIAVGAALQNPTITPFQIRTALSNSALTQSNPQIVRDIANSPAINSNDIFSLINNIVDKINRLRNIRGDENRVIQLQDVLNVLIRNSKTDPQKVMELTRSLR